PHTPPLSPYTTLFRSKGINDHHTAWLVGQVAAITVVTNQGRAAQRIGFLLCDDEACAMQLDTRRRNALHGLEGSCCRHIGAHARSEEHTSELQSRENL